VLGFTGAVCAATAVLSGLVPAWRAAGTPAAEALKEGARTTTDRRGRLLDGLVVAELALPVAGLMSDRPFEEVEQGLRRLRDAVVGLGTRLHEPFLQMAFLALPVIPHLRITDKGLVDVDRFELVS